MVENLVLAHLPRSLAFSRSLASFRERLEPPSPSEVANALIRSGQQKREVWEALNEAQRRAEATTKTISAIHGLHAVDFWSIHYPRRLRLIDEPPWTLFFVGALPTSAPTLAVVGTRRPDSYGTRQIAAILPLLSVADLQIVSGLAYGVDAFAHRVACECRLPNFGVLGSGIDVLYPSDHADLAAKILECGGGLLSEFPPGTAPLAQHFPRRNRLISALADVVWIVQGTAKSGSMHTAKHAADQGKIVVACPGDIFNRLSQVPNHLILEGAHVVLQPDDLRLLLEKPWPTIAH